MIDCRWILGCDVAAKTLFSGLYHAYGTMLGGTRRSSALDGGQNLVSCPNRRRDGGTGILFNSGVGGLHRV